MYLVEQEIKQQFNAICKTTEALTTRRTEIKKTLNDIKTVCFLGCGSSYSVAKSAALNFYQQTGIPSFALPAGDLLVNFSAYSKMLKDALIVVLSRSGSTSEVVQAVKICKDEFSNKVISICAKEESPIEQLADLNLVLPWSFDNAVCQTRTVTNLYVSALVLSYIYCENDDALNRLSNLNDYVKDFCSAYDTMLSDIANKSWTKAVVLGDSAIAGLMEEGALAFKEICRRDSNHYHLLDVRHGPMVQIDSETLVIAVLSSGERKLQKALVGDVAKKTEHLLVLDCSPDDVKKVLANYVALPDCGKDDIKAVFALYCIQQICLNHALARGVDPDSPEGLDPWIKL